MCGRLSVGKDFFDVHLRVGAAMCVACLCGSHDPLAIMPSAETGPDQKHALEALWRKRVFPLLGRPMVHYIANALPKFDFADLASSCGGGWLSITFTSDHDRPNHPGHLVRERHGRDL